jgi:hypothetical protein
LFLNRSDPDSGILATNTVNPVPPQNLNLDDLDFGTQTGFDVAITRSLGQCSGIQLRYFGVDDWDDSQTVVTTPTNLLRFNFAPPEFPDAGDAITSTYSSTLHNAEANLTRQVCDWLNVLAGFRYVELNEQGLTELVNPAVPYRYAVRTDNRLYGGQLGADAMLWCRDRYTLGLNGRAGVYGNHSRHRAVTDTGVARLISSGAQSRTSFIGELALIGTGRLTERVNVRGGYRLLWIDGVALAEDQFAVSDFNNGVGYDGSGDVFYHGAFVGLELSH